MVELTEEEHQKLLKRFQSLPYELQSLVTNNFNSDNEHHAGWAEHEGSKAFWDLSRTGYLRREVQDIIVDSLKRTIMVPLLNRHRRYLETKNETAPPLFITFLNALDPDHSYDSAIFKALLAAYCEKSTSIEEFLDGKYYDVNPRKPECHFPPIHRIAMTGKYRYLDILLDIIPPNYDRKNLLCHYYQEYGIGSFVTTKPLRDIETLDSIRPEGPELQHHDCMRYIRDDTDSKDWREPKYHCFDALQLAIVCWRDDAAAVLLRNDIGGHRRSIQFLLNKACKELLYEVFLWVS